MPDENGHGSVTERRTITLSPDQQTVHAERERHPWPSPRTFRQLKELDPDLYQMVCKQTGLSIEHARELDLRDASIKDRRERQETLLVYAAIGATAVFFLFGGAGVVLIAVGLERAGTAALGLCGLFGVFGFLAKIFETTRKNRD